jgi:hypothetical protein
LSVWTSQWKSIKGIHRLLPYFENVDHPIEFYSNGILYYQLRETNNWYQTINIDHFKGYNGYGKHNFFGHVGLDVIHAKLMEAWFMIDYQGSGKPKNEAYVRGGYNNTLLESMYYGACPVIHPQIKNLTGFPIETVLLLDNEANIGGLLNDKESHAFALDPQRITIAREWIMDVAHVSESYNRILGL